MSCSRQQCPRQGSEKTESVSRPEAVCPEKCSYQDVIWRAEIREVSRSPADRFAAHTDRSPSHRREALDGQERTVAVDGFAPSQLGMACKARGLALPSVDRHGGHH